jgi:hypothetical protein
MRDLVYYRWLHKIEFDPPTEAEKEQLYHLPYSATYRRNNDTKERQSGTRRKSF